MLATIDDLEARLGRPLTPNETAQATALLDDVAASVQNYTGQLFVRGTQKLRARVRRGYVRLSQRPVHEIESVTDRHNNPVRFEWDGLDRVYVHTSRSGLAPLQVVDITYDAGPDSPPPAIVGVVRSIALRALGVDPLESAITQESIDGYAFTIGSAAGAGAYGILPGEARVLDSYRRLAGNIQVGM